MPTQALQCHKPQILQSIVEGPHPGITSFTLVQVGVKLLFLGKSCLGGCKRGILTAGGDQHEPHGDLVGGLGPEDVPDIGGHPAHAICGGLRLLQAERLGDALQGGMRSVVGAWQRSVNKEARYAGHGSAVQVCCGLY